ncbi:rCG45809 [Rattus norvegicus]|uniref:RCG45809 n=1 Tax=Rattus norvegicus TaxID=10116 RepID=A6JUH2_RAT|nr:rCG45809 [Rattus norvegicus]
MPEWPFPCSLVVTQDTPADP